jgi:tetratricopeptide (TPR) repeat protein
MSSALTAPHPETDLLAHYRIACQKLARDANDREAQQQAVLCLARLGATDLAQQDYARYGLGDVATEDAQALLARIHKDLFLRGNDANSLEMGRRAARLYDAAYAQTGGTYSGINAATMLLLTDGTKDQTKSEVRARAQKLLEHLSDLKTDAEGKGVSDAYYIPATRAECHLLLGDVDRANFALQRAVAADPLNYAAHATSLKQFGLITKALGLTEDWLKAYAPPRPSRFAGHLWSDQNAPNEAALSVRLRDLIQRHDIGYAYGALAAGADILIAEACLAEGVSLHLALPGTVDQFKAHSVKPSGDSWLPRFDACLAQAASVLTIPATGDHSDLGPIRRAAEISAGQAILRAAYMSRDPQQLLILDSARPHSLSHALRDHWEATGFHTITADVSLPQNKSGLPLARLSPEEPLALVSFGPKGTLAHDLSDFGAFSTLFERLKTLHPNHTIALDLAGRVGPGLESARQTALPEAVLMSEALAALIALKSPKQVPLIYAGYDLVSEQHLYSLQA